MRATSNPAGNPWLVVVLILVAGSWAAALAFSGPVQARYQSPVSPLSNVPTPTVPPTAAPSDTPVVPAVPTVPVARPTVALLPTVAPLILPSPTPTRLLPEQLTATAVAARFLPAPTLTLPDTAPAGALTAPRRPAAAPAPGLAPAGLIENGLRVLDYAWLACGTLAVIALLAVAAWLIRRRL
ncbi:MAG TPA: hypothetical protein VGA61_19630 [Anaerolineae bacterium]